MEDTIATAWELLLERWDAARNDPSAGSGHGRPMMDVSQVRTRWLLPLFQLLDFHPVYLRGDTVRRSWTSGWPAPGVLRQAQHLGSRPSRPTICSRPSSTPARAICGPCSATASCCASCATTTTPSPRARSNSTWSRSLRRATMAISAPCATPAGSSLTPALSLRAYLKLSHDKQLV